jgi:hypothetical protein
VCLKSHYITTTSRVVPANSFVLSLLIIIIYEPDGSFVTGETRTMPFGHYVIPSNMQYILCPSDVISQEVTRRRLRHREGVLSDHVVQLLGVALCGGSCILFPSMLLEAGYHNIHMCGPPLFPTNPFIVVTLSALTITS